MAEQTWYQVDNFTDSIKPVTVIGDTAKFVTTRRQSRGDKHIERRESKRSDHGAILPTWGDARQNIIDRHTEKVRRLRLQLADALKDLEKAQAIPMEPDHD